MKRIGILLLLAWGGSIAMAQQQNLSNSTTPIPLDEPPLDGYVESEVLDRVVVPYATIRASDVAYSKRIWREFDLREKMNSLYASPRANLTKILMDAVLAGELTAYDPTPTPDDPTGDSFKTRLPVDQVLTRFGADSSLVEQYDEDGNVVGSYFVAADFNPDDVVRYRIKEDWIFDRQRSVFEVRIVGIAPLVTPKIGGASEDVGFGTGGFGGFDDYVDDPSVAEEAVALPPETPVGNTRDLEVDAYPAFWIYFPEARHILVNKEVVSRHNDATGLSYDDVFIKRLFSSYIVKQSNPEDLRIRDYISDGVERLYEAERIKKTLIDFEQDLWSY